MLIPVSSLHPKSSLFPNYIAWPNFTPIRVVSPLLNSQSTAIKTMNIAQWYPPFFTIIYKPSQEQFFIRFPLYPQVVGVCWCYISVYPVMSPLNHLYINRHCITICCSLWPNSSFLLLQFRLIIKKPFSSIKTCLNSIEFSSNHITPPSNPAGPR